MPVLEIEQSQWRRPNAKEPYKLRVREFTQSWSALALSRAERHPVKIKTRLTHELPREKPARVTQARNIAYRIRASIPVSLQRLLDLLNENGEDDHGVVGPTQFAFKTAFEFVLRAEWTLGRDIKSAPVVDSEGGIRITWRSGNRQVKLICPANLNAPIYIYQSAPTGSSVYNQNVTFAALADRLSWLLNGDQSEQPSE